MARLLETLMIGYHSIFGLGCLLAATSVLGASIPKDFKWSDEQTTPFYYATHANGHHAVDLFIDGSSVRISVLDKEKPLFTWIGHEHSVFGIVNDTLWYVEFSNVSSGGNVIAINLTTGQQLWKASLQGLPRGKYSNYRNLINMDAFGKEVIIYGKETLGDYIEVLDAATGKQLAHKVVPDDKK